MALEQGLYELVVANAAVNAIIGTQAYWVLAPKGAMIPFVVMQRISTTDTYSMAGTDGFRSALIQVDCYHTTYYGAKSLALAVRQLLQNYIGNLPDTASTPVLAVFTEKDWDMPYEEGMKGFVYRSMLQFRIWYSEAAIPLTGAVSQDILVDGNS